MQACERVLGKRSEDTTVIGTTVPLWHRSSRHLSLSDSSHGRAPRTSRRARLVEADGYPDHILSDAVPGALQLLQLAELQPETRPRASPSAVLRTRKREPKKLERHADDRDLRRGQILSARH